MEKLNLKEKMEKQIQIQIDCIILPKIRTSYKILLNL